MGICVLARFCSPWGCEKNSTFAVMSNEKPKSMELRDREARVVLIPAPIGDRPIENTLTPYGLAVVRELRHFAVENARTARRYLSALGMPVPISELQIGILDKKTRAEELLALLAPLKAGHSMGVISEAGVPGIADPGALLVAEAHVLGVPVEPLPGPSSILMALMASGLNGQSFAFVGYLPIQPEPRKKRIRDLETRASREGQTQAFIETPYRNDKLLGELLATLRPQTRLCIAHGVDTENGSVRSLTVQQWRRQKPTLGKVPTVFCIM